MITTRTAISNGRGFHQNHPDLAIRAGSAVCIRPFGCNHFPDGIRPWDNADQQHATVLAAAISFIQFEEAS